ncbi:serine/threonine-protein kinase [Streptomyces aculeolatus]
MAETRLIQGRYRLLELLGRGGMGEVWQARDESLGRRVAVKCLKPAGPHRQGHPLSTAIQERFRREARVAALLQHRGVTVVHDFGEDEGVLYLVMELLQGRNLSQLLEAGGHRPLPVEEIIDIAEQVAAALAYTHDQGVVHRDLKPANIMRLGDGTVKILDFGIARLAHDIGFTSRLTGAAGMAMGTPHYMSPEQISGGGGIDHRSDLYSLGCVLYELATGVPPFDMDDAWAILVGHRDTPPEPLRTHRPEIPEPLERVVLDLLAKAPEDRPADAGDLSTRLRGSRAAAEAAGPGRGNGSASDGAGRGTRTGDDGESGEHGRQHGNESGEAGLPPWAAGMTRGARSVRATRTTPLGRPEDALLRTWPPTNGTAPAPATAAPTWPERGTGHGIAVHGTSAPTPGPALSYGPAGGAPGAPHTGHHPFSHAPPSFHTPPHSTHPPHPYAPPTSPPDRPGAPQHVLDAFAGRHDAAVSLARLGRWEEAAAAHRALAAERAAALGGDHPDTLASRHQTGLCLARLGRTAEALEEFRTAAAGRERRLGREHVDTLAVRQETAYALGQLGRHAEALEVYGGVLADRERTMGYEHPDTLRCRHNLAYTLSRLGRYEESYRVASEVTAVRTRVLGGDHPDTLVTRYEVGHALGSLGHWEQALATYREVATARAATLGRDHPDTQAARYEAGICLGRLGRHEEALGHYEALIADRTQTLGTRHPETLRARHIRCVTLGRLGRWHEALTEAREVTAVRERVLGPEHPDTLAGRREIAVALGWLSRWPEALTVHREVARARERTLGASHSETLSSRHDEAHCLEQMGRTAEAAEVYRLAASRRASG